MEPTTPAPTAMDVVAPPNPAPAEAALATPPVEETEAANPDTPAVATIEPQPVTPPSPVVTKEKAPRAPGVEMAITATAIIIIVIAGLAVLAYIKR